MIKSFKHKGLERLFIKASASGVQADYVPRISLMLDAIDVAEQVKVGLARLPAAPLERQQAQPLKREGLSQLAHHV